MNKSLLVFLLVVFSSQILCAQKKQSPIVMELNTAKSGQGNVKVYQDEAIQDVVALRADSMSYDGGKDISSATEYVKVRGFKIQVFSGNNQSRSKNEAFSKKVQVEEAFPELETDVTFNSPFWRLRVGNFVSKEEAQAVLAEMKRKLPSFREMYVVSDIVKHPAN